MNTVNIIAYAHGNIVGASLPHIGTRFVTIYITHVLEGFSGKIDNSQPCIILLLVPKNPDSERRGDHKISNGPAHKPRYNNVQYPKSCLMIAFSLSNATKMP